MRVVVALAGLRGSGKTTLAQALGSAMSTEPASFGDVVRGEALVRGIEAEDPLLQTLGMELIQTWGWDAFVEAVIGHRRDSVLVVDGVRHLGAIEAMERRPDVDTVFVVFLEISSADRMQRLAGRDDRALVGAEAVAERGLPRVRDRADLLLDSTNADDALAKLAAALRLLRADHLD